MLLGMTVSYTVVCIDFSYFCKVPLGFKNSSESAQLTAPAQLAHVWA